MSEQNDDFQRSFGMVVAGFGIGLLVGSVLGLLFAPKSGKELRGELLERGEDLYGKAREGTLGAYETSKDKVKDAYRQAMEALDVAYATGRDFTTEKVAKVKAAVEEGVSAAKEQIAKKTGKGEAAEV